MKALREQFVKGAPDRLEKLRRSLDALEHEPASPDRLKEVLRHFHTLAGSGTTFGFPVVSELARQGEESCGARSKKGGALPADLEGWRDLVEAIEEQLFLAPAPAPRDELTEPPAEEPEAEPPRLSILVVEGDLELAEEVRRHLTPEGLTLSFTTTREAALAALERETPDALVVDVNLPDGSGYDVVRQLRRSPRGDESTAIVLSSATAGFLDKVEAIHAGADATFEKPVDWEQLLRRLQILLEGARKEPPRVLSMEDDPNQAAFLRAVLVSGGYQVLICDDPSRFESDLISFKPDLVLMDVVLPGVSGVDLVRFVRQDERYATLPVLFLTTRSQSNAKIETLRAGGDDHLLKPVTPAFLLSTVAARVERARFLRGLLERDGLTRLLTHTAFFERARALHAIVQRSPKKQVTLVMIDLDDFKTVNDRYGHPTGDRVLAALASHMRRHLRQSDTLGRYGGEEFALLLEDLSEDEATRLVTRLLEEFRVLEHRAPDGTTFTTTFSAGVSLVDASRQSLEAWRQAADDALYSAKGAGKNRVVTAPRTP